MNAIEGYLETQLWSLRISWWHCLLFFLTLVDATLKLVLKSSSRPCFQSSGCRWGSRSVQHACIGTHAIPCEGFIFVCTQRVLDRDFPRKRLASGKWQSQGLNQALLNFSAVLFCALGCSWVHHSLTPEICMLLSFQLNFRRQIQPALESHIFPLLWTNASSLELSKRLC